MKTSKGHLFEKVFLRIRFLKDIVVRRRRYENALEEFIESPIIL